MDKKYGLALFIFRRDLRLEDNTALNQALMLSDRVIPLFIFDDRQISRQNKYRSLPALRFMLQSLGELTQHLKKATGSQLFFFHGDPQEIVDMLIKTLHIDALFVNRDYTPFSLKRDEALEHVCVHYNIPLLSFDDALLNPPEKLLTNNQTPYVIFTPFFKKAQTLPVARPEKLKGHNFYTKNIPGSITDYQTFFHELIPTYVEQVPLAGGRSEGLKLLKKVRSFENYNTTRDTVALPTTLLSAHNKFGTLSIREVYHAIMRNLSPSNGLLRNLYWRDFFTYIAYGSPFVFGHAFQEKYDSLMWEKRDAHFSAWCKGETGFPLVDAGIRELLATGFMHNRARMVVASFLVKDLRIDWRLGEQFFAQHLVDYDPAVNNGNWQWIASIGAGAQPYFRIFNPWLQQKNFDPQGTYIYRWIPELKKVPPVQLHRLAKMNISGYPRPLVNHHEEIEKTIQWYREAGPH